MMAGCATNGQAAKAPPKSCSHSAARPANANGSVLLNAAVVGLANPDGTLPEDRKVMLFDGRSDAGNTGGVTVPALPAPAASAGRPLSMVGRPGAVQYGSC